MRSAGELGRRKESLPRSPGWPRVGSPSSSAAAETEPSAGPGRGCL